MSNSDHNSSDNDGTKLRAAPLDDAKTKIRSVESFNRDEAAAEATQLRPATTAPAPMPSETPVEATLIASRTAVADVRHPNERLNTQGTRGAETNRSFEPGSVIKDRFVLESLLGRGGMGIVFAAVDKRKEEARDPNPHIAIKILNADFRSHPDALVALQREAHKAQALAHPNVVTVYDFDRDGSSVYMTMEQLRGRSLDSVVREARGRGVGRDAALTIIRGIAEGLAYAHRKGIVHSDLKPGNVFVLEDGTPKILDFGIARAVPSAALASKDTFDAGSLGAYTEAYATQEMVDGADPHPADDVYALGLIAYELLTGEHAYRRQSIAQARAKKIEPRAPKDLKRREWRVLQSALAFDRTSRPVDAAEFLRRFFGVTPLTKSLVAAVCVLLLLSGFFWYSSYEAAGPSIPFAQLPIETQQQFKALMSEGDKDWQFYEKDRNLIALWDAVDQYSDAYKLHPRDRDAVKALQRAADAFLSATKNQPQQQRAAADALAEKSDYLAKYAPVMAVKSPSP